MDSNAVRQELVETLQLDLIGPRPQDLALERERLPQTPSRWYLTGFLAPTDAPEEQRAQDSEEELDEGSEPFHGSDDSSTPERASSKRLLFPSSIGLSILVDEETTELTVDVSWGDYEPESTEDEEGTAADGEEGEKRRTGAGNGDSHPGYASHGPSRYESTCATSAATGPRLPLTSREAAGSRSHASSVQPPYGRLRGACPCGQSRCSS